jgi:hypothetical protein
MEAALEQRAVNLPTRARLARGFVLCLAIIAATTILFASWDEYGSAVRRESAVARKEVRDTMRKVTKPLRQAWRDAKRALRSF